MGICSLGNGSFMSMLKGGWVNLVQTDDDAVLLSESRMPFIGDLLMHDLLHDLLVQIVLRPF